MNSNIFFEWGGSDFKRVPVRIELTGMECSPTEVQIIEMEVNNEYYLQHGKTVDYDTESVTFTLLYPRQIQNLYSVMVDSMTIQIKCGDTSSKTWNGNIGISTEYDMKIEVKNRDYYVISLLSPTPFSDLFQSTPYGFETFLSFKTAPSYNPPSNPSKPNSPNMWISTGSSETIRLGSFHISRAFPSVTGNSIDNSYSGEFSVEYDSSYWKSAPSPSPATHELGDMLDWEPSRPGSTTVKYTLKHNGLSKIVYYTITP